ncbi:helix-turn-helix domain-containing protein [Streptomyces sp. NPDC048484]|uniref:helix-turn-helix transcriptional regulator n=1 Tax=Streptomyces sp. NPDC048484 TaxID=3155146 RepID=UPI00343774D1
MQRSLRILEASMSQSAATADDREELLTPIEVSRLTKLTLSTLKDKRWRGTGPKYRKLSPGRAGRVRYRRGDVLDWLRGDEDSGQELAA